MIINLRFVFPSNHQILKRTIIKNSYCIHILRDSCILDKFGYITRPFPSVSYHGIHLNKYRFSTITHQLNDKRVDFTHLPIPTAYVNSLKTLGIKDLKLFQYVIFKLLCDNILVSSNSTPCENFLRLILYNEPGSGQSIGTLIPLLYIYSHKYAPSSTLYSKGSLLVICSGSSCHKITNLVLTIDPSLKCLVLDDSSLYSRASNKIGHDFAQNSNDYLSKLLKRSELSRKGSYDIIVASHNFLLRQSNKTNFTLLSTVSCLLFDDFSLLKDYNLLNRNLKAIKESKRTHINTSECSKDFHVICLINSLGDKFPEYSRQNLSNYTLYDFKFGTKQRLISDSRTDVLKVDVDFGQSKVINLESEELLEDKKIEHSICKVSKGEKYDRVSVLKNLVYSYLDLPTFMYSQALPLCLKKPTPKSKCIIFVSNRKQLLKLANIQEFSNLCVYLGRHLNVYERAKSISSFNDCSRPIMIATDNSVYGSIFDNVSHIFNFNPPKTAESYKSRVAFARKHNSLCVTLYSKDQYPNLVSVIKQVVKKLSVHIVPSKEYMMKNDLKWLTKFINQILTENKNLIGPYLKKSEELISKFGHQVVSNCTNILLRDKPFTEDSVDQGMLTRSILSGRSGFTAVILSDFSKQYISDVSDVKKLFSKYVPDSKINSAFGKCYKTESGYVFDISDKYIKNFLDLSRDNQDICVQIATEIPKIVLNNPHIGKVHKKSLSWNSIDIRKPPAISLKGL